MNVQLNTVSDTRKTLLVTLDAGEVGAEHQAVMSEFIRHARLPGFRPGHAPAVMVAKRWGKEIADEFKQKLVAHAYREALKKEKLNVLNIVDVKEGAIEPGAAAEITVTVDVAPEITLPSYTGLATQIEPIEVTDAEVENVIQSLRGERADFKPVDRPSQKGDYVKLAYEGSIEGKPIVEITPDKQMYAKVPQTWEEVEGAQEGLIPGLGRQIGGLKAGEKKSASIVFPTEFSAAPALAGKTADYALEILEVRERVLPALDADFFKAQGVESLEALRQQVSGALRRQKEMRNLSAQRRQVTDSLASRADFSVPESLVESETQGVLRQFLEDNLRRGVAPESFEADKQRLINEARQTAMRRVRLRLILAKVAEAEKIEADEHDLEQFIVTEAGRSNQRIDKLMRAFAQDRARVQAAQQSIIFDKTVDFLVSKATVSTVAAASAS